MHVIDEEGAAAIEAVCEAIVPGSRRVGPAVYIDALLARMAPAECQAALGAFATLAPLADDRDALAALASTPAFLQVRALAIEAFYSDFVAPGLDAEGAWSEIDFSSPLATRLHKDWSYLGVVG
jgi:hypothetical protein